MLREALKQDTKNAHRIGQLYLLLKARNDTAELYRYHPRLLEWLADRNDTRGLTELLATLEKTEPGFRVEDPELAVRCAGALYRQGEYKAVLKLLQDFHKRFPDSEHLAPAYLLVAQTLANGLDQWDKAVAFLKFIQKKCAQHPLQTHMDTYLAQAENREPLKGPKASFASDHVA
jgi:tetratricopeptide (TPR) repeat protein